jgi:hypothetical protein
MLITKACIFSVELSDWFVGLADEADGGLRTQDMTAMDISAAESPGTAR